MRLILLFLTVTIIAGTARAAVITVDDSTFLPTSWTYNQETPPPPNAGVTITVTRQVSAGYLGDARVMSLTSSVGPVYYGLSQWKTDFIYDPKVSGPIQSIDWTMEQKGATVDDGAVKFIAVQNGNFYEDNGSYAELQQANTWIQAHVYGISPDVFVEYIGSGPSTLDMSSTAAPIYFGYLELNPDGPPIVTNRRHSVSNFYLQITTVPEPANCAIVGIASLFGCAFVRRRNAITK